jgi:hypothetical protein
MVEKKSGVVVKNNRVTPPKKTDPGVLSGPTSASQWKKASGGTPIRVPSGNVALVKRPGLQVFLAQGLIPNSLMEFVTKSLKGSAKPKLEDLDLNPQAMKDMMELVDAVVIHSCLEPQVSAIPMGPRGQGLIDSNRNPDILYVDEVDIEDKMFIFNYAVGGTSDVESFRQELATTVDDISGSEDVVSAP